MTPEQRAAVQDLFLDAFGKTGNVRLSCMKAGIHRSTIYEWQEHDETFALRFKQAEREVEDVLEGEALRRAVHGVQKPLVSMGRVVTDASGSPITITEYSDTLLVKMLAARHHLYGDKARRVEVSGIDGAPIRTEGKQVVTLDLNTLSAEQLATLVTVLEQVVAQEEEGKEDN